MNINKSEYGKKMAFKSKSKQVGFSLIELIIVITIMGLLVSLVAPQMFSKVSSTQRKTAAAQMQMSQIVGHSVGFPLCLRHFQF